MNADVEINNKIAITIHGFETRYGPIGPDGKRPEYDVVTYSPQGDAKTTMHREIRHVSAVRTLEDCGDNLASLIALKTWQRIEPDYLHWKANNALPDRGTPLGAWQGITKAQADVLKQAGLRSIEDVANASEIVINKTGLANAQNLVELAKKFLATGDKAAEAAKQAKLEADNAELREQMAEMQKMMAEMMAKKADDGEKPAKGRKAKEAA